MKRIFSLLLAVCLLISLAGCTVSPSPQATQAPQASQSGTTIQWSADEHQNAEKMARVIIRCLIEKDRDGFKALFCKPTRSTSCFDDYVGNIYNMFHYTSYIGYDYDDGLASYSKLKENEVLRTLQAEVVYIEVTDTDKNGNQISKYYGLKWYWVLTCEENPDLLGIHQLTIELLNTDQSITVGNLDSWP